MEITIKKNDGKNCVSVKTVSDVIGVPVDVIKWTIDKYAEAENMKSAFCMLYKSYWLYPEGILWLMKKTDSAEYTAVTDLLHEMAMVDVKKSDQEEEDNVKKAAETLVKTMDKLGDIKVAVKLTEETIEEMISEIALLTGTKKQDKAKEKKGKKSAWDSFVRNDPALPALSDEEKQWQIDTDVLIEQKAKELGQMKAMIYKIAYRVMNANYGIVFEQVKKEFLEKHGLPKETSMTTYRLVTYDPQLRSIMASIIGNIEEYSGNTKYNK